MKRSIMLIAILLSCVLLFSCSREERNKRAQEAGQIVVEEKASFAKGVGEGLKGVGKEAAESLGGGVGEVIKGGVVGIDDSLVQKEVRVADELQTILNVTRCEIGRSTSLPERIVTAYTIFDNNFDGRLVLKLAAHRFL